MSFELAFDRFLLSLLSFPLVLASVSIVCRRLHARWELLLLLLHQRELNQRALLLR